MFNVIRQKRIMIVTVLLLYLLIITQFLLPLNRDCCIYNANAERVANSYNIQSDNDILIDNKKPSEIYKNFQKPVVQITALGHDNTGDTSLNNMNISEQYNSLGSGFVYDKAGNIVTNYHVIKDSSKIYVTLYDGTIYHAKLIGFDEYSDIAVLRVLNIPQDKLWPIIVTNSSEVEIGDEVFAIGNPFGLSGSMTHGIVSGLGRLLPSNNLPNIIQTDAQINPGNSGGPLLNKEGQLIGITTAIFSSTGQSTGVGFAIPGNTLLKVIPSLIVKGFYIHPWIGIDGINITPEIADTIGLENEPRGYIVTEVEPGGPADKAGLLGGDNLTNIGGREVRLGGDIILQINNKMVRNIQDILSELEDKDVGSIVTLTISRQHSGLDVTNLLQLDVVLGSRPISSILEHTMEDQQGSLSLNTSDIPTKENKTTEYGVIPGGILPPIMILPYLKK